MENISAVSEQVSASTQEVSHLRKNSLHPLKLDKMAEKDKAAG